MVKISMPFYKVYTIFMMCIHFVMTIKLCAWLVKMTCQQRLYKDKKWRSAQDVDAKYNVQHNMSCARQNVVWTHTRKFCRELIVLPCLNAFQSGSPTYETHRQFIICLIYSLTKCFIASQILIFKDYINANFICNAKGIFKSWVCYR